MDKTLNQISTTLFQVENQQEVSHAFGVAFSFSLFHDVIMRELYKFSVEWNETKLT